MKTMQDYTNYCTEEQTRRAFKLCAPLTYYPMFDNSEECIVLTNEFDKQFKIAIPTTQQMIGWLDENGAYIEIYKTEAGTYAFSINHIEGVGTFVTRKQAELAAIDAALDYLEKGGAK